MLFCFDMIIFYNMLIFYNNNNLLKYILVIEDSHSLAKGEYLYNRMSYVSINIKKLFQLKKTVISSDIHIIIIPLYHSCGYIIIWGPPVTTYEDTPFSASCLYRHTIRI